MYVSIFRREREREREREPLTPYLRNVRVVSLTRARDDDHDTDDIGSERDGHGGVVVVHELGVETVKNREEAEGSDEER